MKVTEKDIPTRARFESTLTVALRLEQAQTIQLFNIGLISVELRCEVSFSIPANMSGG
jgi:hypothetical protein